MSLPRIFTAGETVTWSMSDADYSSSDYSLVVNFSSASGAFQAAGVADGVGGWDVTLSAATTAGVAAGVYGYQAIAVQGSGESIERHVIERGSVELLALLDGATSIDPRSTDEVILDAIEATLRGRASSDQLSVSIDGTSISMMTLAELADARDRFRVAVGRKRRRSRMTQVRF